jgi:HAD superfamily hydrolase (TIGR01509 family)
MQMAIKGLIFDFDGLIIDTEIPEYLAWKEIFTKYGEELPIKEWVKVIGSDFSAFDPYLYLEERTGQEVDRSRIRIDQQDRVKEMELDLKLLPGVLETLQKAQEMNLKIGLASSSNGEEIIWHIDRLGLKAYFQAICTGDQVARIKPDPMLYQCAVHKLGLQPHEALAFEDSPNGISAAKAAGLYCVAIPSALTSQLDLSQADLVVPSMAHFSIDEILVQL